MAKNHKSKDMKVAVLLGDPRLPDPVKRGGVFNPEDIEVVDRLKESLQELKRYTFIYFNNHKTLNHDLANVRGQVDYVINFCDEGLFNDPFREKDIPIMLDNLGIPYTGASPACMVLCYDKAKVKKLAQKIGVPIPKNYSLDSKLEFPLIVKPVYGDGSFGITKKSVVKSKSELKEALLDLKQKFSYNDLVIVEEFLPGDEISMGIIGNPSDSYLMLSPIKEDYSALPEGLPQICGHEAKWDPNSDYWKYLKSVPANLNEMQKRIIEESSSKLFESLGCRDYSRFDWRLNAKGEPKLLEVNPNPGWCFDGHLAKMSNLSGISYPQMLEKILEAAEERIFGE